MSQVAISSSATLGLTAAGKVVGWGGNLYRLQRVPDAVNAQPIAQISISPGRYAGAVTRTGRVLTWGAKVAGPTTLDVPTGLTGVKQLALSDNNAIALKKDGTVVAWGQTASVNTPPAGLRATALAAGIDTAYALTEQGTVVGWGVNDMHQLDLPEEVRIPGNVKAIAATSTNAIALLTNNTLIGWGVWYSSGNPMPGWLTALTPVAISGGNNHFGMVDDQGIPHEWDPATGTEVTGMIPSSLNGAAIAGYTANGIEPTGAVITTTLLKATDPTVTGTPIIGNTLKAKPATFSANPTVTGQWLANGTPITGATGTTIKLTTAHLGKKITYRSTAKKTGETTLTATSTALTPTTPPPVASKTKITTKIAAKGKTLTITGKVTATKPPTGKATLTLKKGKTTVITTTVKVSTTGTFKLVIKNFARLVAKKTKATGAKAATAYRGKYTLTTKYQGNKQVKPNTTKTTFTAK